MTRASNAQFNDTLTFTEDTNLTWSISVLQGGRRTNRFISRHCLFVVGFIVFESLSFTQFLGLILLMFVLMPLEHVDTSPVRRMYSASVADDSVCLGSALG